MSVGPRVVIAGTHSGVGKTTVATGLMAALTRRGFVVAGAKVGPDFIDPGYHALATGRPARNLDAWMCGPEAIGPLAGRATHGVHVFVVEGVMGLFDGANDGSCSSTADVAQLLDAPVLLVVDASGMSASIAATVHGFATFDPRIRVAGVIANRVGSAHHADLLREALAPLGIPLLGALHRDDAFSWRDRHLGLVPVVEQADAVRDRLDRLAAAVERDCDVEAIHRVTATAPALSVVSVSLPDAVGSARVALASGPAFSFSYTDNVEALVAAGAEIVPFDPCTATSLPDGCTALVAGGGFPEVYASALAENASLLDDVRRRHRDGLVIWAECGGLLWLADRLDGRPMAGVVPTAATMTDRLSLGYRSVRTTTASPLGATGVELRGHEFHYSTVDPPGHALEPVRPGDRAPAAWSGPRLLATYLHVHLGAAPALAESFVRTASPA